MFTHSWPLDLFWILSFVTIAFAAVAYVVGEVIDRRRQHRQKDANAAPVAPSAGGIRS